MSKKSNKGKASKTYRSEALAAAHEAARDLYRGGGIDKVTMRKFDLMCLTLVERLTASEISGLARSCRREPGRLRPRAQCAAGARQPVGARRAPSLRPFPETVGIGEGQGLRHDRVV